MVQFFGVVFAAWSLLAAAADPGSLVGRIDSALLGVADAEAEVVAAAETGSDTQASARTVARVLPAGPCEWEYRFAALAPGRYRLALRHVSATAAAKAPAERRVLRHVEVRPGRRTTADFEARTVLRVGPNRALKRPSEAAAAATDGAVVEIDAGIYAGDVAVWRQNNLTLRGAGGYARLRAEGQHAQGKAIWVIGGKNVRVERIEFSGAKVPDGNGAGIRHEGENLAICDSRFYQNENGILGGGGHVLIEHAEFGHNGAGDGYTHNLYLSERTQRFTLRHSYSHHARVGHLVKSRARENFLLYNRFSDEADGDSSYAVDLPNGGIAYLIGNIIQQGPRSENRGIVAFGAELEQAPAQDRIHVINNTFVNDAGGGTFLSIKAHAHASVVNNLFVGPGEMVRGTAQVRANLVLRDAGFVDRDNYDYRLTARSRARDAGVDPGADGDVSLRPLRQYVHKARGEERPVVGPIDVGAYEYAPR